MIKRCVVVILIVSICILAIAYTDMIIRPGYLIKTLIKAPIFFFVPLLYSLKDNSYKPVEILTSNLKGLKLSLLLGCIIYIIMVGCYIIVNSLADLSAIKSSLENNLGINRNNFIIIGLYVSFINSFLEEWFFRGFVFSRIKVVSRPMAYIVSSVSFSLYHVAIIDGMFNIGLLILVMTGLFVGGTIFNYLNEKNNNIYSSWFCHCFANLAMNTIGFFIFFG